MFPDYSSRDYWEKRYQAIDLEKQIDWLQPYSAIKNLLHQKLSHNESAEILTIGCGTSSKAISTF